jgi:hypothetical protein
LDHNDHSNNASSGDNNNDNDDNNNNNNNDDNKNNNYDDKVNNSNSFIINNDNKLTSEYTQDLATSVRSRSWRLDVRTLHGICLEISCTHKNNYYSNEESKIEIQNGDFKRETEFRDFISNKDNLDTDKSDTGDCILSGRWIHTKDIMSNKSKKPTKSENFEEFKEIKESNVFNMCLNIELFEASFDVDLFQVCFFYLLNT